MQAMGLLPHTVLIPCQNLAKHIGIEGGMHAHKVPKSAVANLGQFDTKFYGTSLLGSVNVPAQKKVKPYGGWGHPADQQHCMEILALPGRVNATSSVVEQTR